MSLPYFIVAATIMTTVIAQADVVEFTNKQSWETAVNNNYSTINFTGFPDGTPVNNQYVDTGVTFTGAAFVFQSGFFINDGVGLHGPSGLRFNFDSPQNWIAVDYPGAVQFQLFNDGSLLYTSTFITPGGFGNFAGLVSDASFDEVYLFELSLPNEIFIDDLHWGTIPAPSAFTLFALLTFHSHRRRHS